MLRKIAQFITDIRVVVGILLLFIVTVFYAGVTFADLKTKHRQLIGGGDIPMTTIWDAKQSAVTAHETSITVNAEMRKWKGSSCPENSYVVGIRADGSHSRECKGCAVRITLLCRPIRSYWKRK